MPWLAPIRRDDLVDPFVPLTLRWSHWRNLGHYEQMSVTRIRQILDQMGQNAFIWQPYRGVPLPVDLYAQQELISTVSPLLSFECDERHSADRVKR
ncbi:hypothetical protein PIB30_022962 [Stylosanthes scabra]|uniref:Aminotransferase-like plant mobile domain-containing protein n=1 Tax=Stylosanthes scabra TaxID=79078 RepID=A0ABU6S9M7_9FABA|nr:hypothetical protein [Stylosanthes scabra]